MSAAARAEARRKAILSRGSDRLAKLTTSARGEDTSAYFQDDTVLPIKSTGLERFVGEETSMPLPTSSRPSAQSFPNTGIVNSRTSDSSVWSEAQQKQFLDALMGAQANRSQSGQPQIMPGLNGLDPVDDADGPLSSLASQLSQFDASRISKASGKIPTSAGNPHTRMQRLMPVIHFVGIWCLLAYFVSCKEPDAFMMSTHGAVSGTLWSRWAELSWKKAGEGALSVQFVPFLWAFITLQISLHSTRIFTGLDIGQVPALLTLALPHLPPPLPTIVFNVFKYVELGSAFLDDLAGLVFGMGIIVMVASLVAG